jgi:hypothetical protein
MKAKEAIIPTSTNMNVCRMPPITSESLASSDPGLSRPKDDCERSSGPGHLLGRV